jgi:6-pyruvoyltetrahydropterin/6-carboxytetrahydropterin synthase
MIKVTKVFTFAASHRLINSKLSKKKNEKLFGKCFNFPSHGHTFRLYVTIEGPVDVATGMVVNFVTLKKIVEKNIIDKLDHQFLNSSPLLHNKIPTCEHLVQIIWNILSQKLAKKPYSLYSVKVFETDTSFAELMKGE